MDKPIYPAGLPDYCYTFGPKTRMPVRVVKGDTAMYGVDPRMMVAQANKTIGVDKRQEAAMVGGAVRGWQTPYADPANYDDEGCYIGPRMEDCDGE